MPDYRLFLDASVVTVDGRRPYSVRLTYERSPVMGIEETTSELIVDFCVREDVQRFTEAIDLETAVPVTITGGALAYSGVGIVTNRSPIVDAWRGRYLQVSFRLSTAAPAETTARELL